MALSVIAACAMAKFAYAQYSKSPIVLILGGMSNYFIGSHRGRTAGYPAAPRTDPCVRFSRTRLFDISRFVCCKEQVRPYRPDGEIFFATAYVCRLTYGGSPKG